MLQALKNSYFLCLPDFDVANTSIVAVTIIITSCFRLSIFKYTIPVKFIQTVELDVIIFKHLPWHCCVLLFEMTATYVIQICDCATINTCTLHCFCL